MALPVKVRRNYRWPDGGLTVDEFFALATPEPNTGCWLLVLDAEGQYPNVKVNGVMQGAHRHAYEIATGTKLGRRYACHSCDVKFCINPQHIWAGTQSENVADAWRKAKAGLLLRQPMPRAKKRGPQH